MPTKKVVKKSASKKVADRTTVTPTQPAGELFTTNPDREQPIKVPANAVALFINGNDKGTISTEGKKLGAFVVQHASNAGIKRFSAYIDGVKADTADAGMSLQKVKKIEIVAKDSRG